MNDLCRRLGHAAPKFAALLTIAALSITAVACSSSAGADSSKDGTGIPELDAVVEAVVERDAERIAGLIDYSSGPCTTSPGLVGPGRPLCEPGESEGTVVEFLPETLRGVCRSAVRERYVRPAEAVSFIDSLAFQGEPKLYAAYRFPEPLQDHYRLVFQNAAPDSAYGIVAGLLTVQDGSIIAIEYHCGEVGEEARTLVDLLTHVAADDLIVGPISK